MKEIEAEVQPADFKQLHSWYLENRRNLPWRDIPTPYRVWISEIMLQQTRVDTVIPYFERWMARFPDLPALAQARQQEVLKLWEGLGYYSRARNLHRAAQIVVEQYGGVLPPCVDRLRTLPGIGPYTAGAIASIAFGVDEPVVDGNVRRVLSRIYDIEQAVDTSSGSALLEEIARRILPSGEAGDHNQALMELGALVCLPRTPACSECPMKARCKSFASGSQLDRPVLQRRKSVPTMTVTAAVIRRGENVLISQRPQDGLLGGMWEFPGGKLEDGESLPDCLTREIGEELGVQIQVGREVGVYRHAYTHFKVVLHAFECRIGDSASPRPLGVADFRWVKPAELDGFPMGKIDRAISIDIRE